MLNGYFGDNLSLIRTWIPAQFVFFQYTVHIILAMFSLYTYVEKRKQVMDRTEFF